MNTVQTARLFARATRQPAVRGASRPQLRAYASPSKDIGPDRTHLKDKAETDHKTNVQSDASKQAHEDRATGSGSSQATSRRDDRDNNKRAEEEHPEAPRPVIGMNEERGTKGH